MKRTLLMLLLGSLLFMACKKDSVKPGEDPCRLQTVNPAGRSYTPDSLIAITYLQKHCGFMPLSRASYWVYEDSFFNEGIFERVQLDTLRFENTFQSVPDQLIWWEPNLAIGLPDLLYSNDSAIFVADYRLFATDPIRDAKKEYSYFEGDSVKYITSFEDNAAIGRSVKINFSIHTPAGNFSDCILFEKKSPYYRKDQVYFKPGLGVIRYFSEQATMGSPVLKLKQVSTLVNFYLG